MLINDHSRELILIKSSVSLKSQEDDAMGCWQFEDEMTIN